MDGWWFLAFSVVMVLGGLMPLFKKGRDDRTPLPPRKETLKDWRQETLDDWRKKK